MDRLKTIRNFSIIAHIDHGKSTLADRLLETTHTIEKRKMRDQVLDRMDLERERGITIKMQPVRMVYPHKGVDYVLNLIDTPGHIDFSYEVSRALQAVEGSILLVDATQGVQAQTLSVLATAREHGLTIIPVVSKIDSPLARVNEVKEEISKLLDVSVDTVLSVSGKTGEGVEDLLRALVERVPHPRKTYAEDKDLRALIFDFEYSNHQGIIVYCRVLDGSVGEGDKLTLSQGEIFFTSGEVGTFSPDKIKVESLSAGDIGYIVTGIKRPGVASVGDTVTFEKNPLPPLPGYLAPRPVVWASLYPESQDEFNNLRDGLQKLKLSDSSLSFEEESSRTLGRGFRCGFLGMLHLEIVTERLSREFGLNLVITTPSINYQVITRTGEKKIIYSPALFPEYGDYTEVLEPWVKTTIITPPDYVNGLMQLLFEHEGIVGDTSLFGENRVALTVNMPLRELMRNFFDKLKSVTSGFASLSYEIVGLRKADVCRLDILVAGEPVLAFTRVVSLRQVDKEAEDAVERLYEFLPRQLFELKIQGVARGRIIASKTVKALRKDVTGYLYGGDVTRKKKLLEKQKKGKKKMKARGTVEIPKEVFLKMMKNP